MRVRRWFATWLVVAVTMLAVAFGTVGAQYYDDDSDDVTTTLPSTGAGSQNETGFPMELVIAGAAVVATVGAGAAVRRARAT